MNTPTRCLITLAFTATLATPVQAAAPEVPSVIDQFIAKLFPKAMHYFWVINNAQIEAKRELIVDFNAFVTDTSKGQKNIENRYLLIIMDGKILAAQHIPLNSNVDCGKDEEV